MSLAGLAKRLPWLWDVHLNTQLTSIILTKQQIIMKIHIKNGKTNIQGKQQHQNSWRLLQMKTQREAITHHLDFSERKKVWLHVGVLIHTRGWACPYKENHNSRDYLSIHTISWLTLLAPDLERAQMQQFLCQKMTFPEFYPPHCVF